MQDEINILIVDDNPKNIQLAANVLKSVTNYHIYYATSGKAALSQLNKRNYSLILLDIMMPEMDGFETAQQIKARTTAVNIPIIFLTANANQQSIIRAFETGAEDYVTKPFNQLELISRVRTHVELFRIRCKLAEEANRKERLLEQYKKVVDIASIVFKMDTQGQITYVNDEYCILSHFTHDEMNGRFFKKMLHPDVSRSILDELWETLKSGHVWSGRLKILTRDNEVFIVEATIMPIINLTGKIDEYITVSNDITPIINIKQEIIDTQSELLYTLGEISELRSKEVSWHVRRVSEYIAILARAYGMNQEEIELLKTASPMHDVGKIGIADSILLKHGRLTSEEFDIMKNHTTIGYQLFKNSKRRMLKTAAIISHEHHEKWDGSGYPRGLKGKDIHIYGRIASIADVFDALSHKRIYKDAWSVENTLEYIKAESGKSFEPVIVDLFFDNIDAILAIKNKYQPQ
ncbi:MAG: response regulator [gamma proteobacterium symbiont of Bathyaustriella thionipta]|nr:response regulator [gamma proteobacterium symbiont of Bathyaustriella thionipta]MCU7950017.1 response regulator [gamma proteobacterium symbiont of Bathyaustriella thionipta]MCU7952866.1 response regulator [gamma proteobacterium symbiont of Bathyaustriella thionipta]MCU7956617.1 response regulator [gamma proteobacterium symbiont of Bathyaustriella thionipta]MCU7968230.1 response regulator [gamma proteobacterium symbiont of Bathyaustriella thionipta]